MIFYASHGQRHCQPRATGRTGKLDQVRLQGPGQRMEVDLLSKKVREIQAWKKKTRVEWSRGSGDDTETQAAGGGEGFI